MTGLEIVLIMAGFLCLCISAYAAKKNTTEQKDEDVRAAAFADGGKDGY